MTAPAVLHDNMQQTLGRTRGVHPRNTFVWTHMGLTIFHQRKAIDKQKPGGSHPTEVVTRSFESPAHQNLPYPAAYQTDRAKGERVLPPRGDKHTRDDTL